ncbi:MULTISPECIES: 2-hydroxycarboxylate transporter family protein [Bacillus]|uniref:2-hydroxycarboxylate transporter family protein n=1 Tax=Bacillus TaxID=1386 RepID=UPI001F418AD3|nr:2-hydroxycarboxylate transporter family protein [Bacillus haynesii]UIN46069.1 2-hydroxycarboxylate transporter family protein [Bacillus licheniformis]MCY7799853.1 2-hydroxycarboxylate transporter family protein [Bacillus haynesii]MCY8092543.1 2-hydroxycarboxylate transporter family protein [Bacillus haynesii]MCY8141015.1 2-hydroxycarboxylate transporter family protein [Bacillus haynesii]MCY8292619.1 2-hydroxycarboxylate transporter family protein [Bacillus haynesii]
MEAKTKVQHIPIQTKQELDENFFARAMNVKIGIIPLPVYLLLLALIVTFVYMHDLKSDILTAIAVMGFFGFTFAQIGKSLPLLRSVGGAAILATFIPSAIVYYHLIPEDIIKSTTEFTENSNFLYLFISAIVVGSILGMKRETLVRAFIKIFIPLIAGTIAAAAVGLAVGTMLGLGFQHTLLYIVIPIMAGGVGEGAIPLSIGYSEIMHMSQGEAFALVIPSIMFGSLSAVILSGVLNVIGKKKPDWTGNGKVDRFESEDALPLESRDKDKESVFNLSHFASGGILAVSLYLVGMLSHDLFGFPAPVMMLLLAVAVKLFRLAPANLENGAYGVSRFFSTAVTYPLLFAIGVSMTPWDKLIAAFNIANIITIVSVVVTMITVGFFTGKWLNMYPIETAIINACHSGQGGTGDIAILSAAERLELMPFAQVSTRIGGAITVTLTLLLLAQFY